MAHAWFRFYNESVEDPKVQRLAPPLFKFWINVLCLASKHGGTLPSVPDIAFSLRLSERVTQDSQKALIGAGLLDVVETGISPHNWNGRQYVSDVSTSRVQRYRERKRNVSVTPPDTDSEQIQKQTTDQKALAVAKAPASQRGTRWPSEQSVPAEWIEAANQSRARQLLPVADLDTEAIKFANFWASKSGRDGAKIDWKKTWINWALSAKGAYTNGSGRSNKPTAHDNIFAGVAELIDDIDSGRK